MSTLANKGQIAYNKPAQHGSQGGASTKPSSFGDQIRVDYHHKKILLEAAHDQYFQPLADVTNMPKHFGKKIKFNHIMPMLDARNHNDQGLDATGAALDFTKWTSIKQDGTVKTNHATEAAASTEAGEGGHWFQNSGNLYGSSKDVGVITAKIPHLSESGGRVNRVGFTQKVIEGEITKLGLHMSFNQDALDFDTLDDLYGHFSREIMTGANQVVEDLLQVDLLNGVGIHYFGGAATSKATVTGEGANPSLITYEDLQRMSIELDKARCPKQTTMIAGSRMTDTVVVRGCRLLYIGSDLIPQITKMLDPHTNPAFVGVEHYAYAGDYKQGTGMLNGEIGKVGDFRIIVNPNMLAYEGTGAAVTEANLGYRAQGMTGKERYNVFPMLCVGEKSFTTIGFQTDGKTHKFQIIAKMPGAAVADENDPFGETGFMSMKWWYGTVIQRPERLACAWTVGEL